MRLAFGPSKAQAFGAMGARAAGLGLVLVAAVSCGGSDDKGIFGGSSSGGTSASGGDGGSGDSAGGGKPSGGNAGTTVDAGGGKGGGAKDGGTGNTGGEPQGGTGGSGATGGTSPGGGGEGNFGGTSNVGVGPCGDATCSFSAGDICCVHDGGQTYCANEKLENYCKCTGIACGTLEIACDGAEDCPTGKVCCAQRSFVSGSWDQVVCAESCEYTTFSPNQIVCHPGDACPAGLQCKSNPGLPKGYSTCAY